MSNLAPLWCIVICVDSTVARISLLYSLNESLFTVKPDFGDRAASKLKAVLFSKPLFTSNRGSIKVDRNQRQQGLVLIAELWVELLPQDKKAVEVDEFDMDVGSPCC